jgi:hypothetical protein
MLKLEITIDITVKCGECGTELSANYDTRRKILTVAPCEECMGTADSKGYSRGLDDGQED